MSWIVSIGFSYVMAIRLPKSTDLYAIKITWPKRFQIRSINFFEWRKPISNWLSSALSSIRVDKARVKSVTDEAYFLK